MKTEPSEPRQKLLEAERTLQGVCPGCGSNSEWHSWSCNYSKVNQELTELIEEISHQTD